MKKIDLGQTIGILANVGVLAGLILLAFELNQNRDMMRAQVRHQVSQGLIDQFFSTAANPELTEFVQRALASSLESPVEQARFESYLLARFRYWEDVHFQYRAGLYDDSEFGPATVGWKNLLRYEPVTEYWYRRKAGYSPEFVAEIDRLIDELKVGK